MKFQQKKFPDFFINMKIPKIFCFHKFWIKIGLWKSTVGNAAAFPSSSLKWEFEGIFCCTLSSSCPHQKPSKNISVLVLGFEPNIRISFPWGQLLFRSQPRFISNDFNPYPLWKFPVNFEQKDFQNLALSAAIPKSNGPNVLRRADCNQVEAENLAWIEQILLDPLNFLTVYWFCFISKGLTKRHFDLISVWSVSLFKPCCKNTFLGDKFVFSSFSTRLTTVQLFNLKTRSLRHENR